MFKWEIEKGLLLEEYNQKCFTAPKNEWGEVNDEIIKFNCERNLSQEEKLSFVDAKD